MNHDDPVWIDFIADVLDSLDCRKPNAPADVGIRAQRYRDALCALKVGMETKSDAPLDNYAAHHLHLGQS